MQLCYNGKYPENFTIVPMIDESGTIGMILCMGNKETNTLTTLRQIEKLALQLTTRISQNPTVQAA